ncbi:hypothetical protein R3Q06_30630 [Rhodococcus erythropolis]|uniref:hypothetical protein n=1 Tax=Rhodococcus erythropolis TaxID=1833 RepID=UPI0029493F75|nr:hypothetical protein [Rhodococcus erythropolis]MDV6277849.1 hypothetical protein [Rhodococcus erythropolis]
MTDVSPKKSHPHRMRRYGPLVTAVAAGAVFAGAGIGSAATDAVTEPSSTLDSSHESGNPELWHLTNGTDQPVYGTWSVQIGSQVSEITRRDWDALKPGDSAYANNIDWAVGRVYWMGHICYDHKQWNFPRQSLVNFIGFTLTGTPSQGLSAEWGKAGVPTKEDLVYNWREGAC